MSDQSTAETSEDAEAPELASDTRREAVADRLRDAIGASLIEVDIDPTVDMWVRVSADAWADTAAALFDRGFEYFVFLSAIDWMPSPWGQSEDDPFAPDDDEAEASDDAGDDEASADSEADAADETADDTEAEGVDEADAAEEDTEADEPQEGPYPTGRAGGATRFQVFMRLTNLDEHLGITVKADIDESMQIDSLIPVFAGANWHEREAHEMFGINFIGHPDLRNIYLPTDFEGHPMRKDFPLLSRHIKPWPGIVDVEPLPEIEAPDEEEAAS